MGYTIRLTESSVIFKKEHLDEILFRWKKMNHPDNNYLKEGGDITYSGIKVAYASMSHDYDKTTTSVMDILSMMNFETKKDSNGDISLIRYKGKLTQIDLFFDKIADLIAPGQVMMWKCEETEKFAWCFDGKKMIRTNMSTAKEWLQTKFEQLKVETKKTMQILDIKAKCRSML